MPARIQKILSRFGALLGEPEIFDGRGGDDVTAIACFETQQAAEARCGAKELNQQLQTKYVQRVLYFAFPWGVW